MIHSPKTTMAKCVFFSTLAFTSILPAAGAVKEYFVSTVASANVPVEVHSPWALAFDSTGSLYVSENTDWRIRKVDSAGAVTIVAGNGSCCLAFDGVQATRTAIGPYSYLAINRQGNLYISNYGARRVRKVSPDGIIKTIAGTGAENFSGDGGPAAAAPLNHPQGIALDSA